MTSRDCAGLFGAANRWDSGDRKRPIPVSGPPTPMRILHIIQCTNLAGMERVALSVTKGLHQRGHSCRWVSLNPVGRLGPLLDDARISCLGLRYRGPWGAMSIPAMRRAFRSEPHDAVIMVGPNLAAMLALGPRSTEPRMLAVHYHHTRVKPLWQWRLLYAVALRRFQVITFPSDFIRREAECICPQVAPVARTIRNPIEIPLLPSPAQRSAARESLGLPPTSPVIGNAGWLIPRKRFDVFLRVAACLTASMPNALFLIAGDGPERLRLQQQARELAIEHKIRWLGWQTDLTNFYLSLDVLLFNSDWDAFPTTPLEAMSFGIPVVASVARGGLSEVISSPSYGFLLDYHDVAALADHVRRFVMLPEPVAQAGRQRVREMLSPEVCIPQVLEHLRPPPTNSI